MHIECGTCGASLELAPNLRTGTCPYCASPSVVERPTSAGRPTPVFTVGFTVGQEAAKASVRHWQRSRGFFSDSGIKSAAIDSMKGLYVPAYLYSAVAHSNYRARIGENYTEIETYTTTDAHGNTQTHTRTVTKTEWRDLAGTHSSYVMDVLVTASRGMTNAELELVEPFDMKTLRRYTPALLSGWIAEEPTMSIDECVALARQEALAHVGKALGQFMPGDSHQGLSFQTSLDRESIDLVHVPVWVLAVRHAAQKPPIRVLVNGQTSKTWGKAPLSWIKIVIVILAVVLPIVGFVIWSYLEADEPPRKAQPAAQPPTRSAPPAPARGGKK
jgi:hypothetical protein